MKKDLFNYQTFVFDCDGVILNSNKIKTEAFYQTALAYGEPAAQDLVRYHVENGGVSRYKKFKYFLDEVVPNLTNKVFGLSLEALLENYAKMVLDGLLNCELAKGLEDLRKKTPEANWLIVSGGDQAELNEVFSKRKLSHLFDGGIYGSPDTKDEILNREIDNGNITLPALFLGDSKYDYQAATRANLDFVFLSGWSEVTSWEDWCQINHIDHYSSLKKVPRSH